MNIKSYTSTADLFSIANASSGFVSIIMITMGSYALAAKFMLLAVVFDAMDGWIARKLKREDEHDFGKNIDSLSDIISFGVAPGMFLYSTGTSFGIPYISIIVALMIVICGILRLSRFNVITDSGNGRFIGLPIPSTALILGSFYLSGFFNSDMALIIMIVVSLLMISTLEYPKLRSIKILAAGIVLIIAALLPPGISAVVPYFTTKLLFIVMLLYLLAAPVIDLYTRVLRSGPHVR